ncbi:MAG: hypothetical protein Q4G60_15210 [bacterium]|nr:hypothetical protein [bacterium]
MKKVVEGIGFICFLLGAGDVTSTLGPVLLFGGLSIMILLDWDKIRR